MNTQKQTLPWDAGCRCERVRMRVSEAPLLTSACHCRGCQRMTAGAFSLTIALPSAGLSVVKGVPVIGGLHGATRHYHCGHCLSWLFTRPEGLDQLVHLRATMLDDARWFRPYIETWTREGLAWAKTGAEHSYETQPNFEDYGALCAEYARVQRDR